MAKLSELAELSNAKTAVVGILNLQVILAPEDSGWIAQAIEINYAAGGDSIEDVKKRFEDGLCETIHEHLAMFGNLKKLVVPTPAEAWLGLMGDEAKPQWYSQISIHQFITKAVPRASFPFENINYVVVPKPCAVLAGV